MSWDSGFPFCKRQYAKWEMVKTIWMFLCFSLPPPPPPFHWLWWQLDNTGTCQMLGGEGKTTSHFWQFTWAGASYCFIPTFHVGTCQRVPVFPLNCQSGKKKDNKVSNKDCCVKDKCMGGGQARMQCTVVAADMKGGQDIAFACQVMFSFAQTNPAQSNSLFIRANQMICAGVFFFFWKKEDCVAKRDKQNFVQQTVKMKSLFTKLAEKWGYIGEKFLVPLPERKRFVSG